MLARQNQLPLIGEQTAQAISLPERSYVFDYHKVRRLFVLVEEDALPISVETAAEFMRRQIFVPAYQEGDALYLKNTEPHFVRPVIDVPRTTTEKPTLKRQTRPSKAR